MSSAQVGAVLGYIRKLAGTWKDQELPDDQLLERFAKHRDETAFAVILKRHGPMVLGVCQSILHNLHDAEDAFQAAFLLLAKKAGSIHRRESVSGWLYRVAYHLAIRSQANAARRRVHERRAATMPSADPVLDLSLREVRAVLFEELEKLPEQYRSPLVLCGLEEKSREEAARLLGWSPGAVKGKLERGRELLRARLRRRGLELSAGLFATVLSTSSASAQVSATLGASTLKAALWLAAGKEPVVGVMSAKVATLVKGATTTMFHSKLKIASMLLLAMGATASAFGVMRHRASEADQPLSAQGQAEKPKARVDRLQGVQPKPEAESTIEVKGRVLDPDSKPVAGAKIYLAKSTSSGPGSSKQATSGPDGRFRFGVSNSEVEKAATERSPSQVMAIAKGYGCDWVNLCQAEEELTLRLVKDVPVSGRVLDADGRPVTGAKVRVQGVEASPSEDLKDVLASIGTNMLKGWHGPLPGQPELITTEADGRFKLAGFGRERIIHLHVEGPSIQYTAIMVMTRSGDTILGPKPPEGVEGVRQTKVYPASFDYAAEPSRVIRGTVRDKETGKPIPGVRIATAFPWTVDTTTTHTTQTDKDGRYELLGYSKSPSYAVSAEPPAGGRYFRGIFRFADSAGLGSLDADIDLPVGITVRGRVTDKTTGKPVAGVKVSYHALFPNPNATQLPGVYGAPSSATTGPDGTFAVAALPSTGVLAAAAPSIKSYMPALVTPKELKDFFEGKWQDTKFATASEDDLVTQGEGGARGVIGQEDYNVLALIKPGEKDKALTRDLELRPPLPVRKGTVVGPDGKSLTGVEVHGLQQVDVESGIPKDGEFTLMTDPRRTRTRVLVFLHKERGLGAVRQLREDEAGPLTVKLEPCGSATGRIVDKDGQPVQGVLFAFASHGRVGGTIIGRLAAEFTTDKDGRFRVEGLVAGLEYRLEMLRRPLKRFASFAEITSGKNKDLGDITIDLDKP